MKIGILTHPLMYNYGGILQNYALQQVLKDLGHEVLTINRQPVFNYGICIYSVLDYLRRWYKNLHVRKVTRWNPNLSINRAEYYSVSRKINIFIENNIERTEECFDKNLLDIDEKYRFDCYVVGSDQVWVPGCCPLMFINFTDRENVKKLFYAASAGSKSWMDVPEKRAECIGLSKSFSAISVRESALQNAAAELLNRPVSLVLDPTMLLVPNRYFKDGVCPTKSRDYIFTYVLDSTNDKNSIVSSASEILKIPAVSGFTIDPSKRIKETLPGVEDWLQQLYNSNYVITDSFHGCVFSILFKKQFSVIINNARGGNRFTTLLSHFNLLDRVINNTDELAKNICSSIDYGEIDIVLSNERTKSISFLINALQS